MPWRPLQKLRAQSRPGGPSTARSVAQQARASDKELVTRIMVRERERSPAQAGPWHRLPSAVRCWFEGPPLQCLRLRRACWSTRVATATSSLSASFRRMVTICSGDLLAPHMTSGKPVLSALRETKHSPGQNVCAFASFGPAPELDCLCDGAKSACQQSIMCYSRVYVRSTS